MINDINDKIQFWENEIERAEQHDFYFDTQSMREVVETVKHQRAMLIGGRKKLRLRKKEVKNLQAAIYRYKAQLKFDNDSSVMWMEKKHQLKIQPEYFLEVCKRIKTFEIRKNDRDFKVGDVLLLKEYNPNTESYTGRVVERRITYITNFAQQDNHVVMAIL